MNEDIVQRVMANPKYKELTETRSRYGWIFSIIILIAYYIGFIGIIAFDKQLFAKSISGGAMTWGIPVGFGLMILIIALTGIYILIANSKFDTMEKSLLNDVGVTHE